MSQDENVVRIVARLAAVDALFYALIATHPDREALAKELEKASKAIAEGVFQSDRSKEYRSSYDDQIAVFLGAVRDPR